MIVDLDHAQVQEYGTTGPIRFRDKLIKLAQVPEWDHPVTVAIHKRKRRAQKIFIQREVLAANIARLLLVPTPRVHLVTVVLRYGNKEMVSEASVRKFVCSDMSTCTSMRALLWKVPSIGLRPDWWRILLADFVLGNADRKHTDYLLQYNQLITIDWDQSLNFESVPNTVGGLELLLAPYLVRPETQLLRTNIRWLGQQIDHFLKDASCHHSILRRIDYHITERLSRLSDFMCVIAHKYQWGQYG